MIDILALPFFQRVLLAGLLASIACGVIGSLVVAKRISSLSGGISHAAGGDQRTGILAIGAFFLVGLVLLARCPAGGPAAAGART